jgi:hypothetical protein
MSQTYRPPRPVTGTALLFSHRKEICIITQLKCFVVMITSVHSLKLQMNLAGIKWKEGKCNNKEYKFMKTYVGFKVY